MDALWTSAASQAGAFKAAGRGSLTSWGLNFCLATWNMQSSKRKDLLLTVDSLVLPLLGLSKGDTRGRWTLQFNSYQLPCEAEGRADCALSWRIGLEVHRLQRASACCVVAVVWQVLFCFAGLTGSLTNASACRTGGAAAKLSKSSGDWSSPGLAAPVDDSAPRSASAYSIKRASALLGFHSSAQAKNAERSRVCIWAGSQRRRAA